MKAKKPIAKKEAPKKSVVKKPTAKKIAPKKVVVPAPKKSAAKKSAAKKPAPKKSEVKKLIAKKVAVKKSGLGKSVIAAKKKPSEVEKVKIDSVITTQSNVETRVFSDDEFTQVELEKRAKNIDFAMCIAEAMKKVKSENKDEEGEKIRLSRRPVTRTQGKNTVKFADSDLKDFRKKLLVARENACRGVDAMQSAGFNESEDHESDGGDGTAQTIRLQALGQVGNIKRQIQQIDEALHRIDDGSYGVCTACGQLIRKARLLNQPFVLTCMECQNELEKNGR